MWDDLDKSIEKLFNPISFICGVIKFLFTYTVFGSIAVFLIYAAIDARIVINTGTSLLWPLLQGEIISENAAIAMITDFLTQAYNSIPFGDLLGESISFNTDVNMAGTIFNLIITGDLSHLARDAFNNYDAFWREMAVAAIASFVLYAYKDIKDHIHTKDISVWLGWLIPTVFWVMAAFACAETITYALEIRTTITNRNITYVIIIVFAFLFEAVISAFAKKLSVWRTLLVLVINLATTFLKSLFAWCVCFVYLGVFKLIENEAIESAVALLPSTSTVILAIMALTIIEKALIHCIEGKKKA